jgi:hypothetical protein
VGGVFVVLFALIGTVVQPKRFAGIFAAAPSIALASLLVTAGSKGVGVARMNTLGMAAGSVAMAVYCGCAVAAVRRLGTWGSIVAVGSWFAVAAGLYLLFLR